MVLLYVNPMFQFAADVKAELVGKPSKRFFMAPLNNIGIKPENVSWNV